MLCPNCGWPITISYKVADNSIKNYYCVCCGTEYYDSDIFKKLIEERLEECIRMRQELCESKMQATLAMQNDYILNTVLRR